MQCWTTRGECIEHLACVDRDVPTVGPREDHDWRYRPPKGPFHSIASGEDSGFGRPVGKIGGLTFNKRNRSFFRSAYNAPPSVLPTKKFLTNPFLRAILAELLGRFGTLKTPIAAFTVRIVGNGEPKRDAGRVPSWVLFLH